MYLESRYVSDKHCRIFVNLLINNRFLVCDFEAFVKQKKICDLTNFFIRCFGIWKFGVLIGLIGSHIAKITVYVSKSAKM